MGVGSPWTPVTAVRLAVQNFWTLRDLTDAAERVKAFRASKGSKESDLNSDKNRDGDPARPTATGESDRR